MTSVISQYNGLYWCKAALNLSQIFREYWPVASGCLRDVSQSIYCGERPKFVAAFQASFFASVSRCEVYGGPNGLAATMRAMTSVT
jgi:hypothetical protein